MSDTEVQYRTVRLKKLLYNHAQPEEITANLNGSQFLLVGPNGSGKTKLLNAVQDALGVKATDVAGRSPTSTLHTKWSLHRDASSVTCNLGVEISGTVTKVAVRDGKSHIEGPAFEFLDLWTEVEAATKGNQKTLVTFLYTYILASHDRAPLIEVAAATEVKKDAEKLLKEYQPVLDTLNGLAIGEKAAVLQAMDTLMNFQAANNMPKCGVCGQTADPEVIGARHASVHEKLEARGGEGVTVPRSTIARYEELVAETKAVIAGAVARIKKADGIILAKVKSKLEAIENALSKFTPKPVYIKLAGVPEIGTDGTEKRPSLSGAQRVIMHAAFCRVAAESMIKLANMPLPLIITPDKSIDKDHLNYLATALRECPGVTFIQCVTKPRGAPMDGFKPLKMASKGW
jgi:energy-coupling factor transporter ATP-binding protein EcfA2